jgi:class 3 adenylate cyclase/tetratricopeptide (TPR) repeat protein
MTFEELLDQAIALLQRRGRLTYRALKRQFNLDDDYFEDLKAELIQGQRLAVDEDGAVLVWTGNTASAAAPTAPPTLVQDHTPLAYTPKHLAEKILTSRSALEGERKQVTVLFADVAGFTTLAEQLDPEIVHDLINRCFEGITAEVHCFEGTINQYTGDGVMALFGAPIAHEDSPRRAVHAALGIQRAIGDVAQTLQAERGLSLQMRIGVNTGLVVVGKIGDDLRMDYTAVGDTTNLAARLQQMAQPGSVVISAATQQRVAGFFETRDLGEMPVKGRAPVRAFEVIRPRSRRTRFDVAVERGLTPLVSRERELATLCERFSEVKAGRGQVVGIAGEAGMGKSRLVLEFRHALAQASEAVTWLEGRCISFGQASPFLPLIEQLRENFQIDEFDGEPEIIAKVEQGMQCMGELEAHIPAIRYLLSVDPGDPTLAAMEGAARRRQLFTAIRALSLRGARLRPLVLLVEDLHWIDTSSEEFLTFLLDAVAGVPLLLLVTYRIGYTPPFGSRSFYTTLTLHSFSEAETLAMAGHVLGTAQFPVELQTALMEKAEGVPLFIEEVTKTLIDLDVLRCEDGAYRIVKSLSEVRVPDTIQGIIMARLDRLGEDGKRTVQLASVIGRQFQGRLLARVAGVSERLDGLLRELQALEIIYEQGLVPEPAYIFKHPVIQEVAYHSLLFQRRKTLHQAVGEAIEDLYQDRLAEHYVELAHHFSQGEVWEKACHYGRQAGEQAMRQSAYREAVSSFEQALSALAQVPETRATREQAVDLRLALRTALFPSSEFACILRVLREAEALADPRRLAQVSFFLCDHFITTGAYAQAIAAGQRSHALATASGELVLSTLAHSYLGIAYAVQGDYRRAIDCFGPTVAALEGAQRYEFFRELYPPAVFCRAWLAVCHAALGTFAEGRTLGDEGLRIAEAVGHPASLTHASWGIGRLSLQQGDLPRALPMLERALGLCQDAGLFIFFPMIAAALGAVYTLSGRVADAVALLTQALEQATTMGYISIWAHCSLFLGEAHRAAGRLEEAHALAERALAYARAHQERGHQAYALRLLGDIAAQREPSAVPRAAAHYRQALTLAEELGMRPLQAHGHRGLGLLYATTGWREQARTELFTAIEMYRAMEMTFWLPQAEAALAQVEGQWGTLMPSWQRCLPSYSPETGEQWCGGIA